MGGVESKWQTKTESIEDKTGGVLSEEILANGRRADTQR